MNKYDSKLAKLTQAQSKMLSNQMNSAYNKKGGNKANSNSNNSSKPPSKKK